MVYYTHIYVEFFFFCLFCSGLCILFLGICYFFFGSAATLEKNTGYECGFDPFSAARDPLFIRFYLIAILFLLFDIEILLFLPAIAIVSYSSFLTFLWIVYFFSIGMLMYWLEWKKCSFIFIPSHLQ